MGHTPQPILPGWGGEVVPKPPVIPVVQFLDQIRTVLWGWWVVPPPPNTDSPGEGGVLGGTGNRAPSLRPLVQLIQNAIKKRPEGQAGAHAANNGGKLHFNETQPGDALEVCHLTGGKSGGF